jgi:hypothetical protein
LNSGPVAAPPGWVPERAGALHPSTLPGAHAVGRGQSGRPRYLVGFSPEAQQRASWPQWSREVPAVNGGMPPEHTRPDILASPAPDAEFWGIACPTGITVGGQPDPAGSLAGALSFSREPRYIGHPIEPFDAGGQDTLVGTEGRGGIMKAVADWCGGSLLLAAFVLGWLVMGQIILAAVSGSPGLPPM